MLVEAVEHGEVAFARHAEGGVDALRDERFDEGVAGEARRCGGVMRRACRNGNASVPAGARRPRDWVDPDSQFTVW